MLYACLKCLATCSPHYSPSIKNESTYTHIRVYLQMPSNACNNNMGHTQLQHEIVINTICSYELCSLNNSNTRFLMTHEFSIEICIKLSSPFTTNILGMEKLMTFKISIIFGKMYQCMKTNKNEFCLGF